GVQRGSSFVATQLPRLEDALQLEQGADGRFVEVGRGGTGRTGGEPVTAGTPELGAAARRRVLLVHHQAGEQLGVVSDVEGSVGVRRVLLATVLQRAGGNLVERTAVPAAGSGGNRGEPEGLADARVIHGVVTGRASGPSEAVDRHDRQRGVDREAVWVVPHVGGHFALTGEDRFDMGGGKGIQPAPAVTGAAATQLQVE